MADTSYTDDMPSILKSRVAIVLILGIFLIPIATSSLRGLTHVLTCEENVAAPFSVVVAEDGSAVVTSSATGQAGGDSGLCGGLAVDLRARAKPDGRLDLTVLVTNNSAYPWQGTVDLSLNRTVIPVAIGRIDPAETGTDTVAFRLDPGTHELTGSLLVGP
ncbi:hypothetical protein BMS3Abin02_00344 [bacterium BMS3Abin02]|nr:hypothetical protein BMS3Abin02_00344 [bacterium BMS3Abin02]GBE21762.1 hypothetical protein BMS3Bbin01_01114 [bacterium BMS3Bbin01]